MAKIFGLAQDYDVTSPSNPTIMPNSPLPLLSHQIYHWFSFGIIPLHTDYHQQWPVLVRRNYLLPLWSLPQAAPHLLRLTKKNVTPPHPGRQRRPTCEDVPLTRWDRKRRALQREENTDTMELFQQELPSATPVPDVRYWASKSPYPRWKDLSRMALEYLSIPVMSAEPERVFSGANITLSHRRCNMGDPGSFWMLKELAAPQRDGLGGCD